MTISECRRSRRWLAFGLALSVAMATGCTKPLPSTVKSAPVLSVVTGLYPLADAARLIGGDKVDVVDVVPAGSNPLTYRPSGAQVAAMRRAGLVMEVGGGLQAGFDEAERGSSNVVDVAPSRGLDGSTAYPWLDPAGMGQVVATLARSMATADPAAAALFARNTSSLQAELSSLDIDFSSTLSACPITKMVTPDAAFSAMGTHYGLADAVPQKVADIGPGQRAFFTEPWVDDTEVSRLAAEAHSRVRDLDTLAGAPSGGWRPGSSYLTLMERDLGVISAALSCPEAGSP